MEMVKDIVVVLLRIVTILPLLLFVTLFMGRRSVGELPVFDFLVVIVLGAVVGADIADPKINHIPTAVAIVVIGLLQKTISKWAVKSRKLERIIKFEPVIVIRKGVFLTDNMRKIQYSLDNVLELLREQHIFDVRDVDLGIIEANGKLTVYKKPGKTAVTREDLGLQKDHGSFSYPVIVEGKVYPQGLATLNLSEEWLQQQLERQGFHSMESIFFASVNEKLEIHISPMDYAGPPLPPLFH